MTRNCGTVRDLLRQGGVGLVHQRTALLLSSKSPVYAHDGPGGPLKSNRLKALKPAEAGEL